MIGAFVYALSPLHNNLPLLLVFLKESLLSCPAGISDHYCSLLLGFTFPLAHKKTDSIAGNPDSGAISAGRSIQSPLLDPWG